jgi:hypothetical protein
LRPNVFRDANDAQLPVATPAIDVCEHSVYVFSQRVTASKKAVCKGFVDDANGGCTHRIPGIDLAPHQHRYAQGGEVVRPDRIRRRSAILLPIRPKAFHLDRKGASESVE